MPIETLDDIIEELANKLGVYGAHPENTDTDGCKCRCCWTSGLRGRIEQAIEVGKKLDGTYAWPNEARVYPVKRTGSSRSSAEPRIVCGFFDRDKAIRFATEKTESDPGRGTQAYYRFTVEEPFNVE